MTTTRMRLGLATLCLLLLGSWAFIGATLFPTVQGAPSADVPPPLDAEGRDGDRELAYLLVKLVRKTRAVMAGHYTAEQSWMPLVNVLYQRSLARNRILPAAIADPIFSRVVPHATGGRAWVKMVVPAPRNPNNRGDAVALDLLKAIQEGAAAAERQDGRAYYYGEPIKAKPSCMRCHGAPRGGPDPSFPEFTKDGWTDGQVIGAVIARVAARE